MKPDWDKLMKQYADDKDRLIADVDCTGAGKPLCEPNGVKGFPTIKYGDPNNLQDYSGGRDFKAMAKFAASNLGPQCGPSHPDLCDGTQREQLDKFMAFSPGKLDAKIAKAEKDITQAEADFKTKVEKLQADYKQLSEKKDKAQETIKNGGLNHMKSVRAFRASNGEKFKSLEKTILQTIMSEFNKLVSR
jgi:hypothetical protein